MSLPPLANKPCGGRYGDIVQPIGNTPLEMAAFLERERALWGGVIDKAKLKAE